MIAVGDRQILPHLNIYFQVTDRDMTAERVSETLLDLNIKA
jgi:hypothetical protein